MLRRGNRFVENLIIVLLRRQVLPLAKITFKGNPYRAKADCLHCLQSGTPYGR
jgi:hypothetical protein